MFKNTFFRSILRMIDWLEERRRELYFVLMVINLSIAVGYGIYIYFHYRKNPMFENPSTVLEQFLQPTFISMLSIVGRRDGYIVPGKSDDGVEWCLFLSGWDKGPDPTSLCHWTVRDVGGNSGPAFVYPVSVI